MIFLVTDFGPFGPYIGQMQAALAQAAPDVPAFDLLNDAPAFDPHASAHLLAALTDYLPPGATLLCVIDPGVGTERRPAALQADGRWFVGPDNGLFDVVAARADQAAWYEIVWRPANMSASFHGRDLFAPVAGFLAAGGAPAERLARLPDRQLEATPGNAVIYIDAYGNAMTRLAAAELSDNTTLSAAGRQFERVNTFGDAPIGAAFWYANSLGLAELAINQGSAADVCGLSVGTPVIDQTP